MDGMGPVQPTEPYFNKGLWGWDGSQWRKLALLWGYRDRYAERKYVADGVAGDNTLQTTAVPEGYVYVVQAVSVVDVSNAPTAVQINACSASVFACLKSDGSPAANVPTFWTGEVCLKKDDYIRGFLTGVTLNDDLVLDVWGYKMAVE